MLSLFSVFLINGQDGFHVKFEAFVNGIDDIG